MAGESEVNFAARVKSCALPFEYAPRTPSRWLSRGPFRPTALGKTCRTTGVSSAANSTGFSNTKARKAGVRTRARTNMAGTPEQSAGRWQATGGMGGSKKGRAKTGGEYERVDGGLNTNVYGLGCG